MHAAANIGGFLGAGLGQAQAHSQWSLQTAQLYAQQAEVMRQMQQDYSHAYDVNTDSMRRVYKTFRAQLRAEVEAWLPKLRH
jgi:hypothetical protein